MCSAPWTAASAWPEGRSPALAAGALTDEEPSGRITVDPDLSDSDASQRGASRGNVARAIVAVLNEPGTVGRKIDFVDGDVPVAEAVRGD